MTRRDRRADRMGDSRDAPPDRRATALASPQSRAHALDGYRIRRRVALTLLALGLAGLVV